jgi:RNA polymerase sigma-70 factor (ECF subfamily)
MDKDGLNAPLSRFEGVVREQAHGVLTLALRLTGDRHAAEDVSQEVFAALWRAFGGLNGDTNWRAYLYRATVRQAMRQVRRRPPGQSGLESAQDAQARQPEPSELEDRIRQALARLPHKQSAAFTLVRLNGLSYAEAAGTIGCSEAAARVHVHRAGVALRRKLQGFLRRAK